MNPVDAVETVLGTWVLLGTGSSVVRTLVVPRGLSPRVAVGVSNAVRRSFRAAAHRRRTYEGMDAWLTPSGPVTPLVLLVVWLGSFLVGYSLLIAGVSGITLPLALRQAGSSLFTLGFDSSRESGVTGIDFLAAATGPLVIALLIAYLPTLYSAYNRRETEVTLLESRAGNPAWGPEILARHQAVDLIGSLPAFYAGWERWAADVAESHTNYPALIDFRSPQPYRSWVVGLLAVLDSAALVLACSPVDGAHRGAAVPADGVRLAARDRPGDEAARSTPTPTRTRRSR